MGSVVEGLHFHSSSQLPAVDKEKGKGGQPSFSPVSRVLLDRTRQ